MRRDSPVLTAVAWALALALRSSPAPASPLHDAAMDLVREARGLERSQQDDVAARRYIEALTLDRGCGEAYVGLGELRARNGDLDEALRVFETAIVAHPSLGLAHAGRARALRARGARDEARRELEAWAALGGDEAALRELALWYGEDGLPAAQLATWRRVLVLLRARNGADASAVREAETMVRALVVVVAPTDPVSAPPREDAFRRALARIARRAG